MKDCPIPMKEPEEIHSKSMAYINFSIALTSCDFPQTLGAQYRLNIRTKEIRFEDKQREFTNNYSIAGQIIHLNTSWPNQCDNPAIIPLNGLLAYNTTAL